MKTCYLLAYGTAKNTLKHPFFRTSLQGIKHFEEWCNCQSSSINRETHVKIVKAILIAETFDLPARCLVSDTVQFSEKYGCIKCFQTGEICTTAKGGHVGFTSSIMKI